MSKRGTYNGLHAGVPLGSVLGPVLYTSFTSDLPKISAITLAKFADIAAIMANSMRLTLQNKHNKLSKWLDKW